jgi:putative (di)nucleoside polyphosphate hydrolase
MYSSSSPTAITKAKKQQPKEDKTEGGGGEYNPEKTAIVDGKKYRKCACAIVFNDSGSHVLVGERAGKSGSWNLPQGGMEPKETTAEAATRELYEETGISLDSSKNKKNIQVELLSVLENDDAYAYSAGGWLEKKGLAGQRLEFAVFRCKTSADPMEFVNLEGLDGEPAEFTQMKWMSLDECVESVWEAKKKAYEKMRVNVEPIVRKHFY